MNELRCLIRTRSREWHVKHQSLNSYTYQSFSVIGGIDITVEYQIQLDKKTWKRENVTETMMNVVKELIGSWRLLELEILEWPSLCRPRLYGLFCWTCVGVITDGVVDGVVVDVVHSFLVVRMDSNLLLLTAVVRAVVAASWCVLPFRNSVSLQIEL